MNIHDATEQAYKNGYAAGYESGITAAVAEASWVISSDGYYPYCSNCKQEPESRAMSKFCPNCGRKMIGAQNESKD